MKYMLLIHHDEARLAAAPQREFRSAYAAFSEALGKADGGRLGPRLEPAATIVRSDGTRTEVLDGPHAKETLAGYFFVDAESIEGAVEWAARCPSSRYGSIEIRTVSDGTGGHDG